MQLDPQPGYTFEALTTAEQLQTFAPYCGQFEIYDVALNLGEPADARQLAALVAQHDVFVWRMQPDGSQLGSHQAFACLSRYAMAEQAYVFCPEGWDNTAVAAGLEALTKQIFAEQPKCQDVWTCLPTPEPEDAEETLLIMGFTYTPASLDKNRRRTFGLSRSIFTAYHEN